MLIRSTTVFRAVNWPIFFFFKQTFDYSWYIKSIQRLASVIKVVLGHIAREWEARDPHKMRKSKRGKSRGGRFTFAASIHTYRQDASPPRISRHAWKATEAVIIIIAHQGGIGHYSQMSIGQVRSLIMRNCPRSGLTMLTLARKIIIILFYFSKNKKILLIFLFF